MEFKVLLTTQNLHCNNKIDMLFQQLKNKKIKTVNLFEGLFAITVSWCCDSISQNQ